MQTRMKILLSASLAVLALASAPATARQLTIDDCAELSRRISDVLDALEAAPSGFTRVMALRNPCA